MGIAGASMVFEASDGLHQAEIVSSDPPKSIVKLEMRDVRSWQYIGEGLLVDTGSPHYIVMKDDLSGVDVEKQGRELRNNKSISSEGVNVDFLSITKEKIMLRTYERGVEAETLSCGTGVTAAAIAASLKYGGDHFCIQTLGGELEVTFLKHDEHFNSIFLIGPAAFVFSGKLNSDMF
jgi:diaminopimelate epimerase